MATRSEMSRSGASRSTMYSRDTAPGNLFPGSSTEYHDPVERLVHTSIEMLTRRGDNIETNMGDYSNEVFNIPYRYTLNSSRGTNVRTTKPSSTFSPAGPAKTCISPFPKRPTTKRATRRVQPLASSLCLGSLDMDYFSTKENENYDDTPDDKLKGILSVGDSSPRNQFLFNTSHRKSNRKDAHFEFRSGQEMSGDRYYANKSHKEVDITAPIAFIHTSRKDDGILDTANHNKVVQKRLRRSASDASTLNQTNPKLKPAVLRKLNGILKNKGSLRSEVTHSKDHEDDIKYMSLGTARKEHEDGEQSNQLRGGKVQRGTFLTKHSKWTSKSQVSFGEAIEVNSLSTTDNEVSREILQIEREIHTEPNPKANQHREFTPISKPVPSVCGSPDRSRGVYRVMLGDRSVLVIDHNQQRSAIKAIHDAHKVTTKNPGASDQQEDTGPPFLKIWVPPNTPYYDEVPHEANGQISSRFERVRFGNGST